MTTGLMSAVLIALWGTSVALGQEAPKKVTKAEALGAVADKVQPDYPSAARQLKIEGSVELEALVAETGSVEKVSILSGNPVLTRPASEALRKWRFRPFTAQGKPTKALAPVTFSFKL
jgi:periplasmic protein TonB